MRRLRSGLLRVASGVAGATIASTLFVVMSGPTAVAALSGGSNLTTSPVSVTLNAKPGSTVATTLQLLNNSAKPVPIQVRLEKFRASGDSGQAEIYQPSPNDPSIGWVHFSETSFTAEPGVWKPITMTIIAPTTAAFGYYYAVVFSPVSGASVIPGSNVFRGANAILVLLNARSAGEKSLLQIANFSASQNIYQFLPASFAVTIHNAGNVFSAPRGDIYISAGDSTQVLDTIDLNPGQGNVLPGTNRQFTLSWNDGFPRYITKRVNGQVVSDASGQPETELSWDLSQVSHFRFGRYTARLVMVYNDGVRDVPVTATVSFWVIPWTIVLVGLVILALIGLGLWTALRLVIRRPRRLHVG